MPRGLHWKWYTKNVAVFCTPQYYSKNFISAQNSWVTNFSIKSDPELNFSVFEAIEGLLNWAQKVVIGEIHGFYRVLVYHFQCNPRICTLFYPRHNATDRLWLQELPHSSVRSPWKSRRSMDLHIFDVYLYHNLLLPAFGSHFTNESMVIDSWKLNGIKVYIWQVYELSILIF